MFWNPEAIFNARPVLSSDSAPSGASQAHESKPPASAGTKPPSPKELARLEKGVYRVNVARGLELQIFDVKLAQRLARYDRNRDETLDIQDFAAAGADPEPARDLFWTTVVAAIEQEKVFPGASDARSLLEFFRNYAPKLRSVDKLQSAESTKICHEGAKDVLFQTAPAYVFKSGAYVGYVSMEEILEQTGTRSREQLLEQTETRTHDLGLSALGTFHNLNGEMIGLHGFHQAIADEKGSVRRPSKGETTPFALASHFEPFQSFSLSSDKGLSLEDLNQKLFGYIQDPNITHTFEVTVSLQSLQLRSVPEQAHDHPPLGKALEQQREYTHLNIQGTLVVLWTPASLDGVGIAGFHHHFLSLDRKVGGHVLALQTEAESAVQGGVDPNCVLRLGIGRS